MEGDSPGKSMCVIVALIVIQNLENLALSFKEGYGLPFVGTVLSSF